MRHPLLSSLGLGALLIGLSINTYASDREKPSFREHGDKRVERHHRSDRERSHDRRHSSDRRYADHGHRDKKYRDKKHRDKKYRDKRHSYHSRDHHRRRHHDRDKYFLGGLIVGSLGNSIYSTHRRHYEHGSRHGHRVSYWRDRYGDCYRVEHRYRGKVYTEVPRYRCY